MQNVVILPVKGLWADFYLFEAQNHIPPLHTVYVYPVYLFTLGRGEGVELNQREEERGNSSQS
jgi:hypothetical protein